MENLWNACRRYAGSRMEIQNILADIPVDLTAEATRELVSADDVRIERIVSRGHASPAGFWYDQDENEWVVVLKGSARLRFEDRVVALAAGDSIAIAAHTRHRVDWTPPDEDTIWLAVFYR